MALWLAAHHPERVITMTASNTGAKIGTDETWGARVEAVRTDGMAAIRPSVVERWFSGDFADRHPDWFETACSTFDGTNPTGYIGCCHALAGADLRTDAARITAPSLIVGADEDVSTPPEQARWLAARIPDAELTIIEGAGHLSNLDRRTAFDGALTTFLGSP
jgi:pimeloyl-ACP methyl ester carboxylesterase